MCLLERPAGECCIVASVSNPRLAKWYYTAGVQFVNCVCTVEITQYFRRLGIPLSIIFTRAAREPAHNNGCGPLQ